MRLGVGTSIGFARCCARIASVNTQAKPPRIQPTSLNLTMGRLLDICASNQDHPFIEPGKGREHTPFSDKQTISAIRDSILAAGRAPLYTQVCRVRQRISVTTGLPEDQGDSRSCDLGNSPRSHGSTGSTRKGAVT